MKAGMLSYAICFLLGILLALQLNRLQLNTFYDTTPLLLQLLVVLTFFVLMYLLGKNRSADKFHQVLISIWCLFFLLGFLLTVIQAKQQIQHRINDSLVGENLLLQGRVIGLVLEGARAQRFTFKVENCQFVRTKKACASKNNLPKKIKLSWYQVKTKLHSHETWALVVRLKQPHGFMNWGGFDYESWLFKQGIDATGYVRKSLLNQRITPAGFWSFDYFRYLLAQQFKHLQHNQINTEHAPMFALLKALSIGDKSSISQQQWQVLVNTGTSHLMAISGLHIGLAALFAYFLVRRIVPVKLMKRVPAQHVALFFSIGFALMYAFLAGFSIPTQRAMLMLTTLGLMVLVRRNHRPMDALGLAMFLILLYDPFSVLTAGFWFSFSAVAVIFISLSTNSKTALPEIKKTNKDKEKNLMKLLKLVLIKLKYWIKLQWMISIFLLPLSLFMFQQVSLISPLVNLILIPYVSFLVVPTLFLAIVSLIFLPTMVSNYFFTLTAQLLNVAWQPLQYFAAQNYALWTHGNNKLLDLLVMSVLLLLIVYVKKIVQLLHHSKENKNYEWVLRLFLIVSVIIYFTFKYFDHQQTLKEGDFNLTVLDVGQGSAAIIQTKNHSLSFDAGAKFSDKFGSGSHIILPYLREQGIALNRLIVSHGDADHIGGAQALVNHYPQLFVMGQDLEKINFNPQQKLLKENCYSGQKWQWDGVDFTILWPPKKNVLSNLVKRNNYSCVLKVSSKTGSVLLTGDIEKKAEAGLMKQYKQQDSLLKSDVLIVPHHGSKTSSSLNFIKMVNPKVSIISAGYKNRYQLPSKKILCRYAKLPSEVLQTSTSGAIRILFNTERLNIEQLSVISLYRNQNAKFWHHQVRKFSTKDSCDGFNNLKNQ